MYLSGLQLNIYNEREHVIYLDRNGRYKHLQYYWISYKL